MEDPVHSLAQRVVRATRETQPGLIQAAGDHVHAVEPSLDVAEQAFDAVPRRLASPGAHDQVQARSRLSCEHGAHDVPSQESRTAGQQ